MYKIIDSKIIWVVLILIIGILAFMLFFNKEKENENKNEPVPEKKEYSFSLIGEDYVTIEVGSEYNELGFNAYDNNNNNLNSYVKTSSNLDLKTPGVYEIKYILKIDDYEKELVRKVEIKEKKVKKLTLELIGDKDIYLDINEQYEESGIKALLDDEDVSKDVKITNNIESKVGQYTVEYSYNNDSISESVKRNVYIFNLDSFFVVDNDNLTININLDDCIDYVISPSNNKLSDRKINYQVDKSGEYTFKLYSKSGKEYTKTVTVTKKIQEVPLNATCKATLTDGKTKFVVTSSNNNIKSYDYNGIKTTTTNTYTANKYIRENAYVMIKNDKDSKKISCEIEYKALGVKKPSGKIYKSLESDTLKVYIKKQDGWFISYIWAKDPVNQLMKSAIDASKGMKTGEKVLKAGIKNGYKNKIVLGFDASYCNETWYKKGGGYVYEANPLVIWNGKLIQSDYDKYRREAPVYYIDGSNQLKYVPNLKSKTKEERKKSFQAVIDSGAKNTFSFTPVLVENGVAATTYDHSASYEYNAYRQGSKNFC